MTTQPPLFVEQSLREKERTAASSRDGDGHNHPKENRQRCFPYYHFRLWYEPESGGSYIKPRSLLPCLIFAVICVIARSMWMKSTSCLYYVCPFRKSRTMMRAVHQTLPANCRPHGWRAWFFQHAFKLENVLLSVSLHNCQHPCYSSFCWFFPPRFFFFLPCSEPVFNSLCALTDTLIWATLLSSCVFGEVEGGRKVKGRPCVRCCLGLCQHNLCSVIPFP